MLILTVVIVIGCSSTRFAYNNADWYLLNKIDDYFQLTSAQHEKLGEDIHTFLSWHRQHELLEYEKVLSTMSTDYIDGLSPTEFLSIRQHIYTARDRLIERAIPPASEFLSTVSKAQIKNYDRQVGKRLSDKKALLDLTDEQYADESFDELLDTLESWLGDFTDAQLSNIRSISDSLPDDRATELSQNEKYHQQFISLLNNQPGSRSIANYLRMMFFTPPDDAVQKAVKSRSKAQWQAALLKIDQLVSHKQRLHAITKMNHLRDDFLVLSRQQVNPFQPSSLDEER